MGRAGRDPSRPCVGPSGCCLEVSCCRESLRSCKAPAMYVGGQRSRPQLLLLLDVCCGQCLRLSCSTSLARCQDASLE